MVFDTPESPTAKFIRRHITDIGPRVDGTPGTLWLYDPSTTAPTNAEATVLDLFFGFPNRLEGPKTPWSFWRVLPTTDLSWGQFPHLLTSDAKLRREGYHYKPARRHPQAEQWWIRYVASYNIFRWTVRAPDRQYIAYYRTASRQVEPRPTGVRPYYDIQLSPLDVLPDRPLRGRGRSRRITSANKRHRCPSHR